MTHLEKICRQFRWFYKKGYITARDGNACIKAGDNYIVTASGTKKHKLSDNGVDFISLDGHGIPFHSELKPSIETGAHVTALNGSGKKASIHVHSPNTVALAALYENAKSYYLELEPHLINTLNQKWPELFRYTKVG